MLLYHYCTNATFCSIIENKSIWLSSLSLSNDAMEGKWLRGLFEETCIAAGVKAHHLPDLLSSFDFIDDMIDALGFCLSEQGDLLSQWRGYADDGAGLSIGFDKAHLELGRPPKDQQSGFSLSKIGYGEVATDSKLRDVAKSLAASSSEGVWDKIGLLNAPSDKEGWDALTKRRTKAGFPILLLFSELYKVKNPAFLEECEWRLLSFRLTSSTDTCLFRAAGDKIVPYRKFEMPLSEDKVIKRVVLGPKNKSSIRDIQQYLGLSGLAGVDVIRSTASYR